MYYKTAYNLTFSIKKIQQRRNLTIHMTGQFALYNFPGCHHGRSQERSLRWSRREQPPSVTFR